MEFDNEIIMFISLNFSKLENCMPLFLAQYLNNNVVVPNDLTRTLMVYKDLMTIASHNIDFKIDSENIILEKVKHIKK